MSVEVLRFPTRSRQVLSAHRALGRGAVLHFVCDAQPATLVLRPRVSDTAQVAVTTWECRHGRMTLSDAGPLLSMLSHCPVVISEQPASDAQWFWTLYNDSLADAVRAAFGHILPLQGASETVGAADDEMLWLDLEVYREETHCLGTMSLAPATLSRLLEAVDWTPVISELPESLPLGIPLLLGQLSMPASDVQTLHCGDVILPQHRLFDVRGAGMVDLGRQSFHVSFSEQGTTLIVNEIQGAHMSDIHDEPPYNDGSPHDHDSNARAGADASQDMANHQSPEGAFDDLALPLTVRCGTLSMTLGELRRLGPGGMIAIEGMSPGMASLYHGDRPLAHGELVDIDGQLGLQINQLEMP